ncbi:uncharacterized protein F5Z01DRAFT_309438 [Emericellopsis atlantica]|uniref:Apple domain-containing protein n=1 Tax=Emericellopsis atlantica TaxID=2614577 RepID=A0A9P7ZUF2_9HYPO|nr:uncharacterized protein F5Z01DRAFT_309438 [Emericellopsis atlantica]KAG9257915.1 hypothetical protein F5Z01DRAFT_309438 [Emericellopsis atlantica]
MRLSTALLAASFAASAVDAAPGAKGFSKWWQRQGASKSHVEREALRYNEQRKEHELHRHMLNATNATSSTEGPRESATKPAVIKLPHDVASVSHEVVTIDCPLPPVVISVTTVDVTVTVTAEPSIGPDVPGPVADKTVVVDESTTYTTDCEEETMARMTDEVVVDSTRYTPTTVLLTTTTLDENMSATTIIITATTIVPCESETETSTPGEGEELTTQLTTVTPTKPILDLTTSANSTFVVSSTPTPFVSSVVSTIANSSSIESTPEPSLTESTIVLSPSATPSSSVITLSLTTATPTPMTSEQLTTTEPPRTTGYPLICIDTWVTPVTTAKMSVTPAPLPEPTRTACADDHETGAPEEAVLYCGIHGKPAGVYFLAEFIEEKSGVPVTEEGCFQFCDSVMEATEGCQSYRFYHNELGAPRCALYGMPVAAVVDDLDESQDDVWYDLKCGSPTEEGWQDETKTQTSESVTTSTASTPEVLESVSSSNVVEPTKTASDAIEATTTALAEVDPTTAEIIASETTSSTSTMMTPTMANSTNSGNETNDNANSGDAAVDDGNVNSGNAGNNVVGDNNSGNNQQGSPGANLIDIDINNSNGLL